MINVKTLLFLEMSEQCPNPKSIPQNDQKTGEIAHCFDNNCKTGYICQFSKYLIKSLLKNNS